MATNSAETTLPTAILRLRDVQQRTGLSRSTLYLLISRDDFPRQVRLSARAVGWRESEINDWIANRPAAL